MSNQNSKKQNLATASVKDTLAQLDFSQFLEIPESVVIKDVKTSYKYDDDNKRTNEIAKQTITAIAGTTIDNAYQIVFDYVGQPLNDDTIESVLDTRLAIKQSHVSLVANMVKGRFNGYSATGFKLVVTELAPISAEK